MTTRGARQRHGRDWVTRTGPPRSRHMRAEYERDARTGGSGAHAPRSHWLPLLHDAPAGGVSRPALWSESGGVLLTGPHPPQASHRSDALREASSAAYPPGASEPCTTCRGTPVSSGRSRNYRSPRAGCTTWHFLGGTPVSPDQEGFIYPLYHLYQEIRE